MKDTVKVMRMVFIGIVFLVTGCGLPQNGSNQREFINETPLPEKQKIEKVSEKVSADKMIDKGNVKQKIAYITFDDGPSKNNTAENLDTLEKYGIKATFFVLPRDDMDTLYKQILDEGHVIGNHSYSHDYEYLYTSADNFKKDILRAKDFIYKKLNYTTTVFRFPGGSKGRKNTVIQERADILARNGYKYFDWDISTADTDPNLKKYGDEEHIINLLANNVISGTGGKDRLIILMHDDATKTYTAKALPKIIQGLKKQGYRFDVLTNYK